MSGVMSGRSLLGLVWVWVYGIVTGFGGAYRRSCVKRHV